ncbi:MAG: hypothetical protein AAF711_09765 [Planctomycetota bacterium]
MNRFAIVLVVLGAILGLLGFQAYKLTAGGKAQPQTMTAAELIANGPGDNSHIVLTDFHVLTWQTLVASPPGRSFSYEEVWAPVISTDDPHMERIRNKSRFSISPPSYREEVKLILYSRSIPSEVHLNSVSREDKIQGLVTSSVQTLGREELEKLQQEMTIDRARVIIFEHNRRPLEPMIWMLMVGCGILLVLAGAGLFIMKRGTTVAD